MQVSPAHLDSRPIDFSSFPPLHAHRLFGLGRLAEEMLIVSYQCEERRFNAGGRRSNGHPVFRTAEGEGASVGGRGVVVVGLGGEGRGNEGEMRREAGERERTAARAEGEGAPLKGW